MNPFAVIGGWFWLIALAIGAIQFLFTLSRRAADPPDARGLLVLTFAFWNLPWLAMGFNHLVGGVPSIWHYFRPQDGDPFVVGWFVLVLALTLLNAVWMVFLGGAEAFVRYRLADAFGPRSRATPSVRTMKLLAAGSPVFIALWIVGVVAMDAAPPPVGLGG